MKNATLSCWICDVLCYVMAGWTLCCNVTVLCGGGLVHLLALVVTLAVAVAATVLMLLRKPGSTRLHDPGANVKHWNAAPAPSGDAVAQAAKCRWYILGAEIGIALGIACLVYRHGLDRFAWWLLTAWFAYACFSWRGNTAPTERETGGRIAEGILWLLSLTACLITLTANRPDADDCFYVNLAVHAVDQPWAPLLQVDMASGIPTPIAPIIYQIPSVEVLAGAIAYLAHLPAIFVCHLLLPAIFALLICPAYARLFRLLAPTYWIWCTVAVLTILVFVGGPHHWYANFGLVRLHQGKAVLVSALLPLIVSYAFQFAASPSARNWLLLCAAQITALGLTATAIWVAPSVAALALAAALPWRLPSLRTLLVGASSSWYLIFIALVVRAALSRSHDIDQLTASFGNLQPADALRDVFQRGALVFACWTACMLAFRACRNLPAARFCAMFPLGLLLLFLNPYWFYFMVTHVVGPPTYWRVLWVLPLPAILALAATWPLARLHASLSEAKRGLLSLALLGGLVLVIPPYGTLSQANSVRWRSFLLKVPDHYPVAEALNREAGPRRIVLGPEEITTWVLTGHHPCSPLVTRRLYLFNLAGRLAPEEMRRRLIISEYLTGDLDKGMLPLASHAFASSLQIDNIAAVCLCRDLEWAEKVRADLRQSHFVLQPELCGYEIWTAQTRQASTPDAIDAAKHAPAAEIHAGGSRVVKSTAKQPSQAHQY